MLNSECFTALLYLPTIGYFTIRNIPSSIHTTPIANSENIGIQWIVAFGATSTQSSWKLFIEAQFLDPNLIYLTYWLNDQTFFIFIEV